MNRVSRNPWFELVRLPNLLTAPGDPAVGFLLAHTGQGGIWPNLLLVMLASLLMYAGGMILNDVADLEEDQEDRSERPLPSKRVSIFQAGVAGFGMLLFAVILCAFISPRVMMMAACLSGLILTYNFLLKSIPVLGGVVMAACRASSILLGAMAARETAVLGTGVWIAAAVIFFYVLAICMLAKKEMGPSSITFEAWLPLLVLTMGCTVLSFHFQDVSMFRKISFILPWLPLVGTALVVGFCVTQRSHYVDPGEEMAERENMIPIIPVWVGWLIRSLLFYQASLIYLAGKGGVSVLLGMILCLAWFLHAWGCKKYKAS